MKTHSNTPLESLPWRIDVGLSLLQKAVSPRARNSSWIARVTGVVAELEKLNSTTEADFLAVGGNLMTFLDSSRHLHSELASLSGLVAGEHVQRACDALLSVREYVQKTQQRSEESSRALLSLQSSAASIHRGFSTLDQIAKSFQITAILARIEAAHLVTSQHEMGNLADEVQASSEAIKSRAQQVLEAAGALNSRIASTFRQMSSFDAVQQKELLSLLTSVDSDLQAFESRQRDAVAQSAKLSSAVDSVNRELGGIGTSIQAHDITRQQVEHVIQALTNLLANSPRRALSPCEANIVKMQAAQLRSATVEFTRSTGNIDLDLARIATSVEDMADTSKGILGVAGDSKDSALDDMRTRLEEIVRALAQSATLARSTSAILEDLDALSHRLRSAVNDVKVIELQLSRIAINGAISADHIGFPGEPLGVVAAAMQTLQLECAARLRGAEIDLAAIGEVITSFAASRLTRSNDNLSDTLLDDLKHRLSDLDAASSTSQNLSASIARIAGDLGRELQLARDHAAVGQLFGATIENCCTSLESSAAQAEPLWFSPSPSTADALVGRYTMQSERDIHNAMNNDPEPVAVAAPAADVDDVEFF